MALSKLIPPTCTSTWWRMHHRCTWFFVLVLGQSYPSGPKLHETTVFSEIFTGEATDIRGALWHFWGRHSEFRFPHIKERNCVFRDKLTSCRSKNSFVFLNDSFQRADSEYPTLTTLRWAKMHFFRILSRPILKRSVIGQRHRDVITLIYLDVIAL